MSEALVQRPTPIPPHLRREVINVDDLVPDDEVQFVHTLSPSLSGSQLASQPAPDDRGTVSEVIIVNDSDEEVEEMPRPSNQLHRPQYRIRTGFTHRGSPRIPRRILFSPSPPPQDNYIPPVPPLPRRAPEPPMRWHSPPDLAGVFRPLDEPFDFEQHLSMHGRASNVHVSHTVPDHEERPRRPSNMGLGGAILAINRQLDSRESRSQPSSSNRRGWSIPGMGFLRRFFNGNVWGNTSPEPDRRYDMNAALQDALGIEGEGPHYREPYYRPYPRTHTFHSDRVMHDEIFNHSDTAQSYKPYYTHPAKPEPGFSNDFAMPDTINIVDGPESSSTASQEPGSILACVICLDPLVMNVVGPQEEVCRRKLWALRCGHMLDGKCIETLMKPPSLHDAVVEHAFHEQEKTVEVELPSNQNKGKRKATHLDEEEPTLQPVTIKRDRKGKGRANPQFPLMASAVPLDNSEPRQKPAFASSSLPDSLRRLRPRHSSDIVPVSPPSSDVASVGEFVPSPQAMAIPLVQNPRDSSIRARRRGERLRGRNTKDRSRGSRSKAAARHPPLKTAEYEWHCPLANCGHKHKSVLIQNEWRMDEERGAIAVYV